MLDMISDACDQPLSGQSLREEALLSRALLSRLVVVCVLSLFSQGLRLSEALGEGNHTTLP